MVIRIILLLAFSIVVSSCETDEERTSNDYRDTWIGTYEGTKSNRSLDDDMFTTDIEISIELHPEKDSIIIINGLSVPISDEGTFEGQYDGNDFVLRFDGDRLTLQTFPIVLGDAIGCFIKGEKI